MRIRLERLVNTLEDKSLTNSLKSKCEQSVQSTTDVTYGIENLEIPNNFDVNQIYNEEIIVDSSDSILINNSKISNNNFSAGPVTDL